MIDFRYHLVSLISVFLALAVGIVLGAGPLRENLGDQLAGQVEQLRTEQDELRAQSEELTTQNDQLASFITEIGPDLVADTLPEQQIAVLTDDESTHPELERMTSLLEEAGAAPVAQITVQSALWDPEAQAQREDALADVEEIAPAVLDEGLAGTEQLSSAIVRLLAPASAAGALSPELRAQVWQVLEDHQLVSIDAEPPAEVDAVVFASAAPEDLSVDSDDEEQAAERAQGLLSAQTEVLEALVETGLPTVVSGVTPNNDGTTGILRTARGDAGFSEVSTTDRLQEADGPVLAVLALIEQRRGGSGSYGTTTDAQERVPALPETDALVEDAGDEEAAETGEETEAGADAAAASDGGGEQ